MYLVIEISTGKIVAQRTSQKAARNVANKKDLEYGAYNYKVVSDMELWKNRN